MPSFLLFVAFYVEKITSLLILKYVYPFLCSAGAFCQLSPKKKIQVKWLVLGGRGFPAEQPKKLRVGWG